METLRRAPRCGEACGVSWKLGEIYAALIAENARRANNAFLARQSRAREIAVYRDTTGDDFTLELGDGVSYRVPADAFTDGTSAPSFTPTLGLTARLHKAVAVPCAHIWGGDSCMRCARKMCEIFAVPPGTEPPPGVWIEREHGWDCITDDQLEELMESERP